MKQVFTSLPLLLPGQNNGLGFAQELLHFFLPLLPLTFKYGMVQQKWNKVNFYNPALKPLLWLPNRSKPLQLWDILIFETFGT